MRVELLNAFRILADQRSAARSLPARQQQILAFLALHADTPVPRSQVAGCLWPDSPDGQALTNLRRELHNLRETSPDVDRLIDSTSRTLAWRGKTDTVDVVAFERAADRALNGDRAALDEAARLYRGDLLPDCAAEWIQSHRERLRQRAQKVLTRLVAHLDEERAYGEAIDRAQQLLGIDPLDEQAWCALMRCRARRGERAAALHLYQQCAALLKKELDVQPSAATRLTYREILDLDDQAPAAALAPPRSSIYPLIGRTSEWQTLLRSWQGAAAGRPALVLIRGEAGIGKTRLVEELVDWCRAKAIVAVTTRCYAGEGRLAYAPIAAWLQSEALRPGLATLETVWLTDVARLRPELLEARPDVPAPPPQLESWQRSRFFDALALAFRTTAPVLLVVDDLQWSDSETLEWLHYFLRSAGDARCLVVATVRAEEEQDNPALGLMTADLQRHDLLTAIALGPLDEAASAQLAAEVAGHELDQQARARTFAETEGHPLFIVERGRMEGTGQTGAPGTDALSPRVQSVVAARLALLSPEARATVEVAAAVGRDFTFDILAQAGDLEEPALVRALDELWHRHIVRVQAGERWDFSHDRIREVAYQGIGPARTRLIHRRIAQAMELAFAGNLDRASASIAAHLDRGGQHARAIPFLARAADVAARMSATEEAIRCLSHALALVERMPPNRDRDEQELSLRSTLSGVLTSARGYAAIESERNLERVVQLSKTLGRGEVPVRWLWALFTARFMLGDLKAARDVSEQALAQSQDEPSSLCEAHHAMGGTLSSVGELEPARRHFEAALARYDERRPQRSALGSDLGVFIHAWYSHALWLLGDEDEARRHGDEGIALAGRLDHLYSRTLAFAYAALLHQLCGDAAKVVEYAESAVALCERHGFGYYDDWARVLLGWVRGQEGHPDVGAGAIERALERLDVRRAQARRPYYLSLLAATHLSAGRRDRAASILDTAIDMALTRGDAWWLPELYRQKSALTPPAESVAMLQRALDLARAQNSRALERTLARTLRERTVS